MDKGGARRGGRREKEAAAEASKPDQPNYATNTSEKNHLGEMSFWDTDNFEPLKYFSGGPLLPEVVAPDRPTAEGVAQGRVDHVLVGGELGGPPVLVDRAPPGGGAVLVEHLEPPMLNVVEY